MNKKYIQNVCCQNICPSIESFFFKDLYNSYFKKYNSRYSEQLNSFNIFLQKICV